jgi:hypothetical protein
VRTSSIVSPGANKGREVRLRDPDDPVDTVRNEKLVVYPAPYSSRGDSKAVGDLLNRVKILHPSARLCARHLVTYKSALLRARPLSPLTVEGAGRPSPVRNISKSVTPMPSWRANESGPFDRSRTR